MGTNDDGNVFGPPHVEARPTSGAPPTLPPPSIPQPPPFTADEGEPTATVVPTATAGGRSRAKVAGGLIAVLALLGAGGFAITKIVAGDDGGAASPAEVGTRLIDALSNEDALGVVDLLLPGEREMMRQPLIDVVDNLKRLEVVDSTASLDKVGGLDIIFGDVQVEPTPTNVDDITDIRITASSTAVVNGENVPIGKLLIDEAFGGERPAIGSDSTDSEVDWHLATVKRDGRWYLSAFYSIAENMRTGGDDIPARAAVAHGAPTPDGAVQAIFDAVDDLDLERLIGALNPNEAEALQRYAPMFVGDADRAVDDQSIKVDFSDTKFSVTGEGDRRTVAIDGFTMKAEVGGEEITVETKGGCTVVTSAESTTDSCKGASSIDTAFDIFGLADNEDLQSLLKTVKDAFADMKPLGVTVQKVNDEWFVSPVGTFADVVLAVLQALDKDELTAIIDAVKNASDSLSPGSILFPSSESSGGGSIGGDNADAGGTSGALEACLAEPDYHAFSTCVASGIDDGSIDASIVAPQYRFEECGVGEMYFTGAVYNMADEEFMTFANEAAPCFQKHVADGTISSFELPYELSRPDCLEGKNWYKVKDDDYTKRLFECAS